MAEPTDVGLNSPSTAYTPQWRYFEADGFTLTQVLINGEYYFMPSMEYIKAGAIVYTGLQTFEIDSDTGTIILIKNPVTGMVSSISPGQYNIGNDFSLTNFGSGYARITYADHLDIQKNSLGGGITINGYEIIRSSDNKKVLFEGDAATDSDVDSKIDDLKAAKIKYVTPEQYGAVANGTTDDKSAIQSAINTGLPVMFVGNYAVGSSISIPANTALYGFGNAKIILTTNTSGFTISTDSVVFDGLIISGSNISSGLTNQNGIEITGGGDNTKINNCTFLNLGGTGIISHDRTNNKKSGVLVTNSAFNSCYQGVYFYNQSEYNDLSNVTINSCTTGYKILAGNNSFTGGEILQCDVNVFIGTGTNDGHAGFANVKINHGVTNNLYVENITINYRFDSCFFYAGNITLNNAQGVKFNGCEFGLSSSTLTVTNCTNTEFNFCTFYTFGTYNLTGEAPLYFATRWIQTSPPTSIINRLTNATFSLNQNIGIGTIAPDVFGRGYDKILGVSSSTGVGAIELNGTTSAIELGAGGVRKVAISQGASSTTISTLTTTDPLYIQVNSNFFSYQPNGNFGIGVVTPQARLHIKAGTAAAGTAPLKFNSGTLLTAPEAGAVEFLTDDLYFTQTTGSVRQKIAIIASPAFTGTPTAPTPTAGDSSTKIATTAFVATAVANTSAPTVSITSTTVVNAVPGTKYYAEHAGLSTILLPTTIAKGQQILVRGSVGGTGLWRITQNAGQTIHGATNSTTGTGGYIASQAQYDTVALECIAANTDFVIIANRGTLTIV